MCVAETRQPGSATDDVFCVERLIATHELHLELTVLAVSRTDLRESRELQLVSSCLALATHTGVLSQHKQGVQNYRACRLDSRTHTCARAFYRGPAVGNFLSAALVPGACVCCRSRQPGSATVKAFCVGCLIATHVSRPELATPSK